MTTERRFDLIEIIAVIKGKIKFITTITLIAAALGAIFYFIFPKEYEATSSVFVANPLYIDRGNVFRSTNAAYLDYFGDEDDIDKVIAIATSEKTRKIIIRNQGLAAKYELDTTDKKERKKLYEMFKNKLNIRRTEFQGLEFSYEDEEKSLAAAVVNDIVVVTGNIYQDYYSHLNTNVSKALQAQILAADSAIASLTDTLAKLRNQYDIYDILSPNRENIISSSIRKTGSGDFGRAIELIQNIEANKDQLVKDRAKNISLKNEFTTGIKIGKMGLLQVVSPATEEDAKKAGLGFVLTVLAFMLTAFFFGVLWVLFNSYYQLQLQNRN